MKQTTGNSKNYKISLRYVFVILLFSVSFPLNATVLLNSNWENGDYSSYGWNTSGNPTASIVDDALDKLTPVCSGKTAKFSLSYTDPVPYRTEITLNTGPLSEFLIGKEYWLSFNVYLPVTWAIDTINDSDEIIFQFHGKPDVNINELWRNPPIALAIKNDSWVLKVKKDSKINTSVAGKSVYEESKIFNLGKFETGKWTNFVIHTLYTYNLSGFVEIWKDGILSAKKTNGVGYNDNVGPFLKTGIYKSIWNKSKSWSRATDVNSRELYIDEIRIGDATSTFDNISVSCIETPSGLAITQ